jgi:hypothetical protein
MTCASSEPLRRRGDQNPLISSVYQFAADSIPDREFVPGDLRHLVAGNAGRLLDARRTPVAVTRVDPELGVFEVEIRAFEDAGARWELPAEDAGDFQFARACEQAPADVVAALEAAVARFDRRTEVACDPAARDATLRRVAAARRRLALDVEVDVEAHVARREGVPELYARLDAWLGDLAAMDRQLAATLVSNPRSGEHVKAHAIVLAELGLCPYRGKVLRDPRVLTGEWSRARRAEHLVARLAFTWELWSRLGPAALYRAAATEGPLPPERPRSLVSATFAREVAEAHFVGGPRTQVAVMWRQRVAPERLFMTFLETAAMNARYREAEAILIADPGNRAF